MIEKIVGPKTKEVRLREKIKKNKRGYSVELIHHVFEKKKQLKRYEDYALILDIGPF